MLRVADARSADRFFYLLISRDLACNANTRIKCAITGIKASIPFTIGSLVSFFSPTNISNNYNFLYGIVVEHMLREIHGIYF